MNIKNVVSKELVITKEDLREKENIIIESIENCIINIPCHIKSLYIKDIKDSKLRVGAVSGASFINEMLNSEIHLCSHQIRIHNSHQVDFYLIAKSNPIIEHCDNVRFGVAKICYDEFESHLKEAQLFEINNLFNQVQDFNWLKQDKSPNWNEIAK